MTRLPLLAAAPAAPPGGAGIPAHPHNGRSPGARRAPWRRVRGEQPWARPASRTSLRLRESAGPEAEAEASSGGWGCAFSLGPSQTMPILTFV